MDGMEIESASTLPAMECNRHCRDIDLGGRQKKREIPALFTYQTTVDISFVQPVQHFSSCRVKHVVKKKARDLYKIELDRRRRMDRRIGARSGSDSMTQSAQDLARGDHSRAASR